MSDGVVPSESGFMAAPAAAELTGQAHERILATTVCAVVEHGGELLMVRQLNREAEPRWNFPTGWMVSHDEDGHLQLPEHAVNRNLLIETGYGSNNATLIGMAVVHEHDESGRRIGTSLRLNYLCGQPRQTTYAVNDPDILGAPEWHSPEEIEQLAVRGELKGELTLVTFRHWQEYRRTGGVSAGVVDIPN
jgi:ADP-ribose pyrophosphatase YjhB (NUDIX family)